MKLLQDVMALTVNLSQIRLARGEFDTEQELSTYLAGLAFIETFVKMSRRQLRSSKTYELYTESES